MPIDYPCADFWEQPLNQSTEDSYTRRPRHVEITRLYERPSVPMSCGLI